MPAETIHACQCGPCSRGEAHPDRERHYQTNLFLSRLDEDQRRWYLALESQRMGWGADRLLMEISGVDEKTIRRGREELAASLVNRPADRVTAQKWVRSSLRTLSAKLEAAGHVVSPPTVSCLLRKLDYSLHVNAKKMEASSNHPDRGRQFDYIAVQRATFTAAGLPIISTDSKKNELVGDFKNAGQTWSLEPIAVNVHDFPGDADGRAVPYGVYDITTNRGFIYLGTSGDTPAFAVDAIAAWWQSDGHATWPGDHLLVLADAGGSNGCRIRAWKERLQVQICDRFGLTVTVCHYPTGCSKWNPIEHRLFSQISCNWAGVLLRTWDTLLAFIRGTTTRSGLTGRAVLERGEYPTGQKITDAQMAALRIERHAVCPQWNYTIRPRTPA